MDKRTATRLAENALRSVTVTKYADPGNGMQEIASGPVPVADTTVLFLNENGTYSVTDNGEEVDGLDRANALRVMVENLTA